MFLSKYKQIEKKNMSFDGKTITSWDTVELVEITPADFSWFFRVWFSGNDNKLTHAK